MLSLCNESRLLTGFKPHSLTSHEETNVFPSEPTSSPEFAPRCPSLDEIYLTLPEAARYCRMATPTFRLYLKRKEIAGIKLGKAWLFTKADLDAFLARYRVRSNAEITEMSNQILRRAR